jgi:choline kinase
LTVNTVKLLYGTETMDAVKNVWVEVDTAWENEKAKKATQN